MTISSGKALDKKIGTLERRLNYLNERIFEDPDKGRAAYNKAEASALRFALDLIESHREDAIELLTRKRNPER